jgi:hypothetical protein
MAAARFRITYQRYAELRDDLVQMVRGGLMVKVTDTAGLELHAPVALELVLPDGTPVAASVEVLHVFPAVGVAVSVTPELVERVRRAATGRDAGAAPARHDRLDRAPASSAPAPAAAPVARPRATSTTAAPVTSIDGMTMPEKIQLALHGNRDQRMAILRDTNRTLHPFVLKNPQVTSEDALAMVKNALTTPELLRLVAERKEWSQKPQIAIALARNPKTPTDVAIRALDHCPVDALRQLAKGSGAPPLVVQAARKKILR